MYTDTYRAAIEAAFYIPNILEKIRVLLGVIRSWADKETKLGQMSSNELAFSNGMEYCLDISHYSETQNQQMILLGIWVTCFIWLLRRI